MHDGSLEPKTPASRGAAPSFATHFTPPVTTPPKALVAAASKGRPFASRTSAAAVQIFAYGSSRAASPPYFNLNSRDGADAMRIPRSMKGWGMKSSGPKGSRKQDPYLHRSTHRRQIGIDMARRARCVGPLHLAPPLS